MKKKEKSRLTLLFVVLSVIFLISADVVIKVASDSSANWSGVRDYTGEIITYKNPHGNKSYFKINCSCGGDFYWIDTDDVDSLMSSHLFCKHNKFGM